MPRPVAREELSNFHAPMLIIAGEKDPFFPGEALVNRARKVLPASASTLLLKGESHLLSAPGADRAVGRIEEFLEAQPSISGA